MLRARSLLAVVLFAACALSPGLSRADFKWDVPDVIRLVEVPEMVKANGYNVRLAGAVSKKRPADVAQYYMDAFQKAGFYVPWQESQRSPTLYPQLTGLDTEHMVSYTVIIQPNADNTTTILFGTTDLSTPPLAQADDFVPLFPGAKGALRTSTEGMRSIAYGVTASEEDVFAYYREVLGTSGFVEKTRGAFVRDDVRVRLLTQSVSGGTRVLLTRMNADPLDDMGVPNVQPVLKSHPGAAASQARPPEMLMPLDANR